MTRLPLVALLAVVGCAGPARVPAQWETLAKQCADVLDTALPALKRCAAHQREFHDGAKLNEDGSLDCPVMDLKTRKCLTAEEAKAR